MKIQNLCAKRERKGKIFLTPSSINEEIKGQREVLWPKIYSYISPWYESRKHTIFCHDSWKIIKIQKQSF